MSDADGRRLLTHATALALPADGAAPSLGLMLRGASGSGKSDLALRLLRRGAKLISDDQVILRVDGVMVEMSAPATIAGLMEIRGIGIIRIDDPSPPHPLHVVVDLVNHGDIERLPPLAESIQVLGVTLRRFHIDPFDASAVERIAVIADLIRGRLVRHA